ncbi:hypothetical protein QQZ08_009803 [Neonectria magnoliae]|uniref:PD-(D/E)XK nuclease-like domain-containing protein n=1 Tax=Neonectria magnoliae TaxID=2732573 RepID=A0ABR1HLF6_9HYPO
MQSDLVLDWLEGIPYSSEPGLDLSTAPTRKILKRRRVHQAPTPDPPSGMSSIDDVESQGARKRPHVDEETPRPKQRSRRAISPPSLSDHASYSQKSASQTSNRSPQRQLAALELVDEGVIVREMSSLQDRPPELASLLSKMQLISRGIGILDPSLRPSFRSHHNARASEIGLDAFWFSNDRNQLGCTPGIEAVLKIHAFAAECAQNSHPEANWITLVHDGLLRLALQPPHKPLFTSLVGHMPCTTATILSCYLPSLLPPKKVDYCIYVDPSNDSSPLATASRIANLRQTLPGKAINHTNFYPLRHRPIALSIETKKTGEGWDGATLQMGVWQSAHWSLLRSLTNIARTNDRRQKNLGQTGLLEDEPNDIPLPERKLPQFLPGIIIQGHDWNFVLTTPEGSQTVLWTKLIIGSTSDILGIYQIVCALQVLRDWIQTSYWPYLRELLGTGD